MTKRRKDPVQGRVNTMKQEYKVLTHAPLDARLTADRHTNSRLPVTRFTSVEQVENRRKELRKNLLMAAGLYPLPERTPLRVKTEPVGDFDGYSVKKIMFETRPGFWSTGNLYLPAGRSGPAPAILNVIGHWRPQRLYRGEDADYPQQLANFARMGFVCLVTDMIGWVDSRQISHEYGGGEKDLYASNGLGIQLWNNIRALDLLCSMPEVDAERIGVTGASGGGSQTLFLSLADDRVKAAAPINMISLKMQGGCRCENAAGLRIDTDNAEMCAMFAPRPLFLAGSTGDWTNDQETVEYPAMLESYRLYNAADKVEHYYQVAEHQYNHKTRQKVYSFFARHLMGKELNWTEQEICVEDLAAFTWFREEGRAEGIGSDEEFFRMHGAERRSSVEKLPLPQKKELLRWALGVEDAFCIADATVTKLGDVTLEKNIINAGRGQQIPFVRLIPENWDGQRAVLCVSGRGKDCLEDTPVQALLQEGVCVVGADVFLTGEYGDAQVKINGGEVAETYFTTFHHTVAAHQAADIALLWRYVTGTAKQCSLRADGCAARAAACVLPLLEGLDTAYLEKSMLELSGVEDYYKECFIPSILSLGGMDGCIAMASCRVELF